MRKKIEIEETRTLEDLIPSYAQNKLELDSYKKICESENEQIKKLMEEMCAEDYYVENYKAVRTVTHRVSINEDKLLAVMKKHNISEVIKTKEYVDTDALENYLYHIDEEANKDLFDDIDKCRDIKEVVQLRVTSQKGVKNVRE